MAALIKGAALAAVILAAGCTPRPYTDHHITRAESMKITERGNSVMSYAGEIRDAIHAAIYAPEQYAGKRCLVRMHLARDGMVISARSEGGDPAFCQVAVSAVRQAKIPPAPSDEMYEVFKNAPIDFQL